MAVQPVVDPAPALTQVLRARDSLPGDLIEPLGRERMSEQLVRVAVRLEVVVLPGGATVA